MKKRLTDEQMTEEIAKAKRVNNIVFGVLLLLLIALIIVILMYKYQHSFSTAKWRNNPEHRTRMVDDMLTDTTLIGMTEAEVISLLGESNNGYGYFNENERLVYCLGAETGLISIDNQWLIINFEDGTVSDYFITTD